MKHMNNMRDNTTNTTNTNIYIHKTIRRITSGVTTNATGDLKRETTTLSQEYVNEGGEERRRLEYVKRENGEIVKEIRREWPAKASDPKEIEPADADSSSPATQPSPATTPKETEPASTPPTSISTSIVKCQSNKICGICRHCDTYNELMDDPETESIGFCTHSSDVKEVDVTQPACEYFSLVSWAI